MKSLNKVMLIGFIGKDPQNKNNISTVSLATNNQYKDKEGKEKSETEWHRLVFFGKLSEIAIKYLKKGAKIYVEGTLQTKKFFDQKLQSDKQITEIIVKDMIMLDSKKKENELENKTIFTEESDFDQQSLPF